MVVVGAQLGSPQQRDLPHRDQLYGEQITVRVPQALHATASTRPEAAQLRAVLHAEILHLHVRRDGRAGYYRATSHYLKRGMKCYHVKRRKRKIFG